jgi:hypothetical protein
MSDAAAVSFADIKTLKAFSPATMGPLLSLYTVRHERLPGPLARPPETYTITAAVGISHSETQGPADD